MDYLSEKVEENFHQLVRFLLTKSIKRSHRERKLSNELLQFRFFRLHFHHKLLKNILSILGIHYQVLTKRKENKFSKKFQLTSGPASLELTDEANSRSKSSNS